MHQLLTVSYAAECLSQIVSYNPIFKNRNLFVTVIANEKAGGFTQKKISSKNKRLMDEAVERARLKEVQVASIETKVFITEYPRHAEELAAAEVAQCSADKNENAIHLIFAAGGDGTSLEVQTGLYKAALSSDVKKSVVMNKIAVFRLPLGTGNDGTDGRTLEESLSILENASRFTLGRAVTVTSNPQAGENNWYSFNIASIGLDAYVVYNTNKMKAQIPGNSYHLWVNLSALKYNSVFPPQEAKITLFDDEGNEIQVLEQSFELAVFGLSGNRCYGGGHHILPNENNICIVPKCTPVEMAFANKKFIDGSFVGTKYGKLYTASKMTIEYSHDIYCQLDGEEHLLSKNHFPLVFNLSEPIIQLLA